MAYTYNVTLTRKRGALIEIDTNAMYGYWERADGSEGGGLWFAPCPIELSSQNMELIDFDGIGELSAEVVSLLRGAGFYLDNSFDV